MSFDLKKFFGDVFKPDPGEVVTIMYDLPHGNISDKAEWKQRREMAIEWHNKISEFANYYQTSVNPIVTYLSTGTHNGDLPEKAQIGGEECILEDIIAQSTIVLSMPEFSASAPLMNCTSKYPNIRVGSMPMVTKAMEESGLSADYKEIARKCEKLGPLFNNACQVEVQFSTGHQCIFDISNNLPALLDTGLLPPNFAGKGFSNLPAGEVCTCPNEASDSKTNGEIPAVFNNEQVLFIIKNNQVIDVQGDGPVAMERRESFKNEPALRNIAEVAIGCNDKATVTGNVLEDEKAGFHWAYGRSDFLGGNIGVSNFSSPEKVYHMDIVYAKGNPIVCQKFDFIFSNGTRQTVIKEGELKI
jgi:hypothetical protein